jgi:hypothetical protein
LQFAYQPLVDFVASWFDKLTMDVNINHSPLNKNKKARRHYTNGL